MKKYFEWCSSDGAGPGERWYCWYVIIDDNGVVINVNSRGRRDHPAVFSPIKSPINWLPVKRCTMLRTYRKFGIKLEEGL